MDTVRFMNNRRKSKLMSGAFPWIAPAILVLLLITIIPTFFLFYLSLNNWELATPWDTRVFVWFKNFIDTIKNEQFQASLFITIKYVVSVLAIELLLCILIASNLNCQSSKKRLFVIVYLILHMTLTPSVAGPFSDQTFIRLQSC